jgi:hypothetical protein
VNSAEMSMEAKMSLGCNDFISFGNRLRSGTAVSYGSPSFNF